MASPIAVPTMPDSASGVSKTRFSPNSCWRPSVTRKTPPSRPTSSPKTRVRGSPARAWRSAALSAWTSVSSGIGGAPRAGRPGWPEGLRFQGHRDRPLVVLDEEHDRRLEHAGEVHGLVDITLGGGAVAEVDDGGPPAAVQSGAHRPAHRVQGVAADRGRDGAEVVREG